MNALCSFERFHNYYKRRLSFYCARDMRKLPNNQPFISFTFDDFPRSAVKIGGGTLKEFGLRCSYYASFGLMGTESPVGTIFSQEDLEDLIKDGHEIGCHTFDHLDAWKTDPIKFQESIIRNVVALHSMYPDMRFKTFSYPISEPHPRIKQVAGKLFDCCLGGGQVFNADRFDRNLLKSCYIDHRNRGNLQLLMELIDRNSQAKGWLVFSTHDVCENPSPFGCTPNVFRHILSHAVSSGSEILPVCEVYESIQAKSR